MNDNPSNKKQPRPPDEKPSRGPAAYHRSVAERSARGKQARARVLRSAHASWVAPNNRPDPIDLLEAQAATRIPELVAIRYGRMLLSPFAFYRGAAAIMACDLAGLPHSGLFVQLCGDAHLANFGGFASPERDIVFDINDFDETLPGPWEWDVKRLVASIEIVGRERKYSNRQRRAIILATIGEYRRAMREFAHQGNLDVWYALLDAERIRGRWGVTAKQKDLNKIEGEFSHAYGRDNWRAFEKLTHRVGDQLRIVSHPPLVIPIEELYPHQAEQQQADQIYRNFIVAYRQTLPDERRQLLEQFTYTHLARKVVGVGSVGTRTWIALLLGKDDGDPLFLQIKEAQASVLETYLGKSKFADSGKRVVEGQRLMQASTDIFLGWEQVRDSMDDQSRDYYVRQLWDWKLSIDLELMPAGELAIYSEMCGWTLAHAHARSGDRIAIASYLGKSDEFEQAMVEFASAYADQNQQDYQALVGAVKSGRIKAQTGV